MKIIYKADYSKCWKDCRLRERLYLILLGALTIIEGSILFFSLGFFTSDLRAMFLFNEKFDNWVNKGREN
jgi:hypothetical protein